MMENKIMMKDKIAQLSNATLGISGENEQEKLIFLFEDGFVDGTCYLELEFPNREKYSIEIEKKDESYCLEVRNSLLRFAGSITMQLKIVQKTAVWKSATFNMVVDAAINAVESIKEDYPNFVERIDIRMQEIEVGFKQLDEKVDSFESFSGNYDDLENKPEIPSVAGFVTEEEMNEKMSQIKIPDEIVIGSEPTDDCKIFINIDEEAPKCLTEDEVKGLLDERIGGLARVLDEMNGVEV